MKVTLPRSYWQDWLILMLLWFVASMVDVSWLILDQLPPAWDQGDHLSRAMHYWQALQHPNWFSSDWWQSLWKLSPSYRGPFVYLLTVPIFSLLGQGADQAVMVNSFLTGPLIACVYLLGLQLFDRRTGLLAATACLFIPSFVLLRTDYLLDYGLSVCVLAAFVCLTYWRDSKLNSRVSWLWGMGFGLTFGITLLSKPTGLLFFVIPILWVVIETLRQRQWIRLGQLLLAAVIAFWVVWPWFQANWLTILTTSGRSTVTWIPAGVEQGNRWSAWSYYARILPYMLSRPLFYVPIVGWGLWLISQFLGRWLQWPGQFIVAKVANRSISRNANPRAWAWLLGFIVSSYVLLSLLQNKDPRHILPYAPMVIIALVRGITVWRRPWGESLGIGLLAVMTVLTVSTFFPLPMVKAPYEHRPYLGATWPHREVVDTIVEVDPYLASTLGVLPNTATMNPMNLDFYGALKEFRVYGRELGFSADSLDGDAQSLSWYVTKTGDGGPQNNPNEVKATLQQQLEQSTEVIVQKTWPLPDGSTLNLLRRRIRPVRVYPYNQEIQDITIESVEIPQQAAPGSIVPTIYRTVGPWQGLQQGILLLTWQAVTGEDSWIHDHGVGLGYLYEGFDSPEPEAGFKIEERLFMKVPETVLPGRYKLAAAFLNRSTGDVQPVRLPETLMTIDSATPVTQIGMLDLGSQLRQLSQGFAQGNLDPIFQAVGRMNQYDPNQDYLKQVEQSFTARLETQPDRLDWYYGVLLAQVLQQKGSDALHTIQKITQIAPDNPYHWAYLGFLHLYQFQPRLADKALEQAAQLDPNLPNLKTLQGGAAILKLNFPKGWRLLKEANLL